MDEMLHPAQIDAVEKLKRLKVGALYIDRQEGKFRTVAELIRYRLETDRIDRVICFIPAESRNCLQRVCKDTYPTWSKASL